MPRWFKVWTQTEFHSFEKRSDSRFDRIENRLDNIESRLTKVETDVGGVKAELTNVIKLNNLKH
jgi:archaellum component FlaC